MLEDLADCSGWLSEGVIMARIDDVRIVKISFVVHEI